MANLGSILKGFNKTIEQLDALVDTNTQAIVKTDKKIDKLVGKNAGRRIENRQALRVKDNIEKLLGGA